MVVLSCPSCGSTDMIQNGNRLICKECGSVYALLKKAETAESAAERSGAEAYGRRESTPRETAYPAYSSGNEEYARKSSRYDGNVSYPESSGKHARETGDGRAAARPSSAKEYDPYAVAQRSSDKYSGRQTGKETEGRRQEGREYGYSRKEYETREKQGSGKKYREYEDAGQERSKMIRAGLLCFLAALVIILALGVLTGFKFLGLIIIIGICAGGLCFLVWMLLYHTRKNKRRT